MQGFNHDWLFAGAGREHKGTKTLSEQISERLWKELGLEITPHQFRHAAAYIMLKADPGNYELVRRVLGHRSSTTTRNFYIGLETLEATRLFGEMVTGPGARRGASQAPREEEPCLRKSEPCLCATGRPLTAESGTGLRARAAFAAWWRRRPHESLDPDQPGTGLRLLARVLPAETACSIKDAEAGAHVTPEIIDAFVNELHGRVGSVTRASYIGKIRRIATILAPGRDLVWLGEIEADLRYEARPRPKYHRIVSSERLLALGLELIRRGETSKHLTDLARARLVRDGLMIALLALCPIRLSNLAELRVGRQLRADR